MIVESIKQKYQAIKEYMGCLPLEEVIERGIAESDNTEEFREYLRENGYNPDCIIAEIMCSDKIYSGKQYSDVIRLKLKVELIMELAGKFEMKFDASDCSKLLMSATPHKKGDEPCEMIRASYIERNFCLPPNATDILQNYLIYGIISESAKKILHARTLQELVDSVLEAEQAEIAEKQRWYEILRDDWENMAQYSELAPEENPFYDENPEKTQLDWASDIRCVIQSRVEQQGKVLLRQKRK